jgi:hypothetical protein
MALTVWAIAVLSLLYWSYLYLDYGARMPAEPQQATGRILPLRIQGPDRLSQWTGAAPYSDGGLGVRGKYGSGRNYVPARRA